MTRRGRHHYKPQSDLATLAAACGWGLVTSHPYRDGNKRTAFLGMTIFLGLNGYEIEATQEDVVTTMLAAAGGQLTESQLADWVHGQLGESRLARPPRPALGGGVPATSRDRP